MNAQIDHKETTKAINHLTTFGWAVASIEPHGIVAVFHTYAPALAHWVEVSKNVPAGCKVYLLKLIENRIYGVRDGEKQLCEAQA